MISIKELKNLATERLNAVAAGCTAQLFTEALPLTRLNRRSEEIVTLSARNHQQRFSSCIITTKRLKLAEEVRPRINE
jgi:hypothetical protein